jgi:uncharacterized membrane protein
MAHCTKCGAVVADNAGFCTACGAPQSAGSVASQSQAPATPVVQSQMDEKLAALLSYLLGWVTGIVFFLIDKRPYVRFHAAQSIVVFGGLQIVLIVLGVFSGLSFLAGGATGFSLGWTISRLIDLAAFVLWIVLMIKAYQGQKFRVPIAADIAEKLFGTS